MLGDVLKREIYKLKYASTKKVGNDAFWVILREIALKIQRGRLQSVQTSSFILR